MDRRQPDRDCTVRLAATAGLVRAGESALTVGFGLNLRGLAATLNKIRSVPF
jgi:hypothetical protein